MNESRLPAHAGRSSMTTSRVFSPTEFASFLQSRLLLVSKIAFSFILIDYLLSNSIEILSGRQGLSSLVTTHRSAVMLLDLVVFASMWRICSRGSHGLPALRTMDAFGIFFFCWAGALESWLSTENTHGLVSMATLVALAVMGRAVIVPGTARLTFVCSALAHAPLVAAAYHASIHNPERLTSFSLFAIHAGLASGLATVASAVIYRLEHEVRKAEQLGQYRLEEKVGAGAMGEVYRARHAMLRRPTAVKILREEMTGDRNLGRFEREVQLTSQLTHPNTVAIYDYGRTPEGTLYYAMEFLDGITLEELVLQHGPQPPARVVHILSQICASLTEAHEAGLIHRDIKPANVILCERGRVHDFVKLVDFGLVKDIEAGTDPSVSVANSITGTPLYMSPEAIRSPGETDHRSDLYAVGAVGYFLLTGKPLFESKNVMEICSLQMSEVPSRPSERRGEAIPPSLEALVMKALSKEREERPQSAFDFRRALEKLELPAEESWTEDEASAWWSEHGTEVRARGTEQEARDLTAAETLDEADRATGAPTLSIDLSARDDPPAG